MIAYFGKQQIKDAALARIRAHADADEIVKGRYWENGKGCAIGCQIHGSDHMLYEIQFGIPVMLAHLEDRLFEGMPNEQAMLWPERFMSAIEPGADLSLVGWKFQWWLLTDETINPGINHQLVKEAVKLCADALYPLTKGLPVDQSAESAAWAARSARSAESAARSARSAAESAAWAAWAAESAAWAARSAAWAAESASAYSRMADKLIEIISECKGDAA